LHLNADGAQLVDRHVGNVEVHRLAERVLAVFGHGRRARAQEIVGGERAIAADDVDRLARAGALVQLPDRVEQARVHGDGLVAPPVAQEAVELGQGRRNVTTVLLERDRQPFLGVIVVEVERARVRRRRRSGHGSADGEGAGEDSGEMPVASEVPDGGSRPGDSGRHVVHVRVTSPRGCEIFSQWPLPGIRVHDQP
jgi:hypothetical protein